MRVVVLGAGMQGTLYGARLALAGHAVTLIAPRHRAAQLREHGAVIENALTEKRDVVSLPVAEALGPDVQADLCLVTVRREQLAGSLPALKAATGIDRILFMVNHACGSSFLFDSLGRRRVILGFPGAAGSIEDGVDRYVEVAEQPTVIEASAPDVAALLKQAGFSVSLVRDMDSWLRRHAVFVTVVGGALYAAETDPRRLAADGDKVRDLILAVREGWKAMDRLGVGPAPMMLRVIFVWMPLWVSTVYWRRLLGSVRGEYYFARHTRRAAAEMAALAADIRALLGDTAAPRLWELYARIDAATIHPPG